MASTPDTDLLRSAAAPPQDANPPNCRRSRSVRTRLYRLLCFLGGHPTGQAIRYEGDDFVSIVWYCPDCEHVFVRHALDALSRMWLLYAREMIAKDIQDLEREIGIFQAPTPFGGGPVSLIDELPGALTGTPDRHREGPDAGDRDRS